jgi:hypothetical protein
MRRIIEAEEYNKCQNKFEKVILFKKRLPDQIFTDTFSNFVFIDFDDIFFEIFFHGIISYLKGIGENVMFLAVIEPDPVDYFYRHFKKYPVLELCVSDTLDSYESATQEDPGGSPADAIAFNSTVLVLYSDSMKWAIYADRDFGLGVVAFTNKQLMQDFVALYGKDRIFDVNGAISQILEVIYVNCSTGIPTEIRNQLINNYQSK